LRAVEINSGKTNDQITFFGFRFGTGHFGNFSKKYRNKAVIENTWDLLQFALFQIDSREIHCGDLERSQKLMRRWDGDLENKRGEKRMDERGKR
jgi:hypothetical protein